MNKVNLNKILPLAMILSLFLAHNLSAQARLGTDERRGAYYGLGLAFGRDAGALLIEVGLTSQGRIDFGGVFGVVKSSRPSKTIYGEALSLYPVQQFLDNSPVSISIDQSAIFAADRDSRTGPVGNLTFSIGASIFTTVQLEPKSFVQPTVGAQWVKTPGDLQDNFWSPYAGLVFVIPKEKGGAVGISVSVTSSKDGPTSYGISISNFVLSKPKSRGEHSGLK